MKAVLRKLLFPPCYIILPAVPLAACLLIWSFSDSRVRSSPAVYVFYAFSAYTLTVVCIRVPAAVRRIKALLHKNRFFHRLLSDPAYRASVSLRFSFAVNLLFAAFNLISGLLSRSAWLKAVTGYYVLLALLRFLLLLQAKKNPIGVSLSRELSRYRVCGWILLVLNLALAVMVGFMAVQLRSSQYSGSLIYAVAAYTFYSVTVAVVSIRRYRAFGSPLLSAAKAVGFCSALVSLLSLEAAMLRRFGSGDDERFRRLMIAVTGGCICTVILAMAVYMIVHSTNRLRRLEAEAPGQ